MDQKSSYPNRTAIVTGASSGIGEATAHLLARNGYNADGAAHLEAWWATPPGKLRYGAIGQLRRTEEVSIRKGVDEDWYFTRQRSTALACEVPARAVST